MTSGSIMKWKDYRFHFFDRNPQIFAAFEASLEEIQTMVFDFSERKKYNLTRHALDELRKLLTSYLVARDRSLRVPSSTMAMFFPSETTFDGVLTRQLERLKAHADRGIANSDQELIKQIASVLFSLSIASLQSHSYFAEHGENSVTTFVSAYLDGVIQGAAARGLDDVAMEGADHLRNLCKSLIEKELYVSVLTQASNLEKLAALSVISGRDVVLAVAVRSLCESLLHNCIRGHPGTHITNSLIESLVRITKARLASPLGLDMTKVSYSVGPFISPTERSSFAAISIAMVNAIVKLSQSGDRKVLGRLRSLYEEMHDRAWLDFAELGIEAVKKNSFLLHYINSTLEEVVGANFHLIHALVNLPRIQEHSVEDGMEQHLRDRFLDEVKNKLSWETTGVYSRVVPAMFDHQQLTYLDDTIKKQCLFALWAAQGHVEKVAIDAIERIFRACVQLQDPKFGDVYASARLAINIAQIGIYAIALGARSIFSTALERYSTLWQTFRERYSDLRSVGEFESAERELLEHLRGRPSIMIDRHEVEFYSRVTPGQIRTFFASLKGTGGGDSSSKGE